MDHDGTPNSTPDPSLLVKANTGSPAYTPSPIFSDEEADDEATKDGSGSKATSVLASGTDHELDSKNESNEGRRSGNQIRKRSENRKLS